MALIGIHRLKRDVAAVLDDLAGNLLCQAFEALLTLFAVVFRIDLHTHAALVAAAIDRVIGQLLNRVKRFTAAADQRAELVAIEIDLVAILLGQINLNLSLAVHVLEQALKEGADLLGLFVAAFLTELDLFDRLDFFLLFLALRLFLCAYFFFLKNLGLINHRLLCLRLFLGLGFFLRFGHTVVIAHTHCGGRAAKAQKTGLGAFKNLNRNIIAIHVELAERELNGFVLCLSRYVNKLDHITSSLFYSP